MRRIALLSLTVMLNGCGYNTWWNPPFTTGYNPNRPVSDSVNMSRVLGQDVAVKPLTENRLKRRHEPSYQLCSLPLTS